MDPDLISLNKISLGQQQGFFNIRDEKSGDTFTVLIATQNQDRTVKCFAVYKVLSAYRKLF